MTRDKKLLALFGVLTLLFFGVSLYALTRFEKEGLTQGRELWARLYGAYKVRLASLESIEKKKPDEVLLLGRTLHNVGTTALNQTKLTEAEQYLRRALELKDKDEKFPSSSIGETLDSLACTYRDLGYVDKAKVYTQNALTVFGKSYGESSRSVARVEEEMADLYGRTSDYGKGEASLKRALKIYDEEDDISQSARCHVSLAWHALAQMKLVTAEKEIDKASQLFTQKLGKDFEEYHDSDLVYFLQTKGRLLMVNGHNEEASRLLRKAADQSMQLQGDNSIVAATTLTYLADSYLKQKQYKLAEEVLKQAQEKYKLLGLELHRRNIHGMESLEEVLRQTNRSSEADQLKARRFGLESDKESLEKRDSAEAAQIAKKLRSRMESWYKRSSSETWFVPVLAALTFWAFTGMFACAMACAAVASRKDMSAILWFFAGFIFGALALIVILAWPRKGEGIPVTEDGQVLLDARMGTFILTCYPLMGVVLVCVFLNPLWLRDALLATIVTWAACFLLFPMIWTGFIAQAKGLKVLPWSLAAIVGGIFAQFGAIFVKPALEASERIDDEILRNRPSEVLMLVSCLLHILSVASVAYSILVQVEKHMEW